jgi:hypothetical protein
MSGWVYWGWASLLERSTVVSSMRIGSLVALIAAIGGTACTPPHYSVGVARGPTHITYAQRHHDVNFPDYLVDCELDPDGTPSDKCTTVPLEAD